MHMPPCKRLWHTGLNCLLVVGLALLTRPVLAAPAATIGDTHYVGVGGSDSGTCATAFPPCATVAYAVSQASSGDTINIGAGTFHSTAVNVTKSLTFHGQGMNATILDGDGTGTVLYLGLGLTISISGLTVTGGSAGSAGGGGICQYADSLILANVRVTNNHAAWAGGIYSTGTLTITDSEISNNWTTGAAGTGTGGGIELVGDNMAVSLTRVTISGNTAGASGGGIQNQGKVTVIGGLTLTNVTLSGNTAHNGAGMLTTNGAYVHIDNSTIAANHLDGTAGSQDGGIANYAQVTLKNSIVAGNDHNDCWVGGGGTYWGSAGNNISSDSTCGFSSSTLHDRQNTNPRLGVLQNNGGPIQTMALLVGSPAIDGVTYNAPNGSPSTDARGVSRPFGTFYDIGAYEANSYYVLLPLVKK